MIHPFEFNPQVVVLANGDYPSHPLAVNQLTQAPAVICCDGAADAYIARGGRPVAIIGDGDSLSNHVRSAYSELIIRVEEQETNDLTKAMHHAHSLGWTRILILGATGKREDHTLGNISLLGDYLQWGGEVRMFTDQGVFVPVVNEGCFRLGQGQKVSVFNFDTTGLQATGLAYPLYDFDRWWQGTLNTAVADTVTIRGRGRFLVYLPY